MYILGAVGGSLNAYILVILSNFHLRYRGCHSVPDMAQVVGGRNTKEIVSLRFIVAYVLSARAVIVGMLVGINTLPYQAACTGQRRFDYSSLDQKDH